MNWQRIQGCTLPLPGAHGVRSSHVPRTPNNIWRWSKINCMAFSALASPLFFSIFSMLLDTCIWVRVNLVDICLLLTVCPPPGESGLGKSTLINSLFLTDLYSKDYPGPSQRIKKTVQVRLIYNYVVYQRDFYFSSFLSDI